MKMRFVLLLITIYLVGVEQIWAAEGLRVGASSHVGKIQRSIPFLNHDELRTKGTAKSQREPKNKNSNATIGDLVDDILKLDPLSQLNLITSIMLKSHADDGFNNEQQPIAIAQVFAILNSRFDDLQEDLNFDALIIRYLVLNSLRFKQSQSGQFEDEIFTDSVKVFFQKRVAYWETHISKQSAKLFNIYGELLIITSSLDWILANRAGEFLLNTQREITSSALMESGQKFRISILFAAMKAAVHRSQSLVDDLIVISHEKIALMNQKRQISLEVFHWINTFNFYLDGVVQTIADNSEIPFEKLVYFLDERISINRELVSVARQQLNQYRSLRPNIYDTHPLLASYLDQIDCNQDPSRISSAIGLNEAVEANLIKLEKKFSRSLQIVPKYHQILEEDLSVLHSRIVNWNLMDRITAYQISLLAVEFGHNYLLNRSAQNSIGAKRDYVLLRDLLQVALCMRYFEKYQGHTCDVTSRLSSFKSQSTTEGLFLLRKLADEITEEKGITHFIFNNPMNLNPGIFIADSQVSLEFKELNFHPLSMIYTNGQDIRIKGNRLNYAWIDSSGIDQSQDKLAPPADGLPSRSDGFKGQAPSKPSKADSGTSGGTIQVTAELENSLLVAFGGDAEDGFDGAASPNCIHQLDCLGASGPINPDYKIIEKRQCSPDFKRYIQVVHNWSATISTRGKDCSACHVGSIDICKNDGNRRLWCGTENVTQRHSDILDVNAGPGGDGGDAGSGGDISLPLNFQRDNSFMLNISGKNGIGGSPGNCGPNPEGGKNGKQAFDGKIQVLERETI